LNNEFRLLIDSVVYRHLDRFAGPLLDWLDDRSDGRVFSRNIVVRVVFFCLGIFGLIYILCVDVPLVLVSQLKHVRRTANSHHPPLSAQFLFYLFLDAHTCDAIVGDLEERYRILLRKFGSRRANFWYWTQTIRSVGPIASAWIKKVMLKPVIGVIAWAVAKGLLGHDSWLAALVEVWRRLRS
jgi:hypothetical protein